MKKSLLEIAHSIPGPPSTKYDSPEVLEISLAWLHDEISFKQFKGALGITTAGGGSVPFIAAMTIREGLRSGRLTIHVAPDYVSTKTKKPR